jgi:transcriptional regulator with XRE-family HTH domain
MLSEAKFKEIIGNNIKRIRLERDISQEKLSEDCGFYRTYINLIETGKRVPTSYNLHRIAKALKVSVADIYPA